MKKLFLLRHARAGSAPSGKSDLDRPLTEEGEKAAHHLGKKLAHKDLLPDMALFSTARRAEFTWTNLVQGAKTPLPAEGSDWLYHATPHDIITHLRHLPDTFDSIMIIGHNPTLHSLAHDLAKSSDHASKLAGSFPPGTLAIFRFSISSWQEISKDRASLEHIFFPEE
ncbi:MAG: hypothetical protein A2018_02770 [Alphaproteobacteria bacterium GWF2_58_20]|nr:MAG: hypothetical protein A2018_02770 [Alphaproteobacteria bacterium GWF2_58_20]